MSKVIWKLYSSSAQLCSSRFSGATDIAKPQSGFQIEQPDSADTATQYLCINFRGAASAQQSEMHFDGHVRLNDLIAQYPETSARPFSAEVYWRALADSEDQCLVGGIDLIVSAETSTLDANPQIEVASVLPQCEMFRLVDLSAKGWAPIVLDEAQRIGFDRRGGPCCVLFRPTGENFSYVEMVHPADLHASELSIASNGKNRSHLDHVLIQQWMEKGVIVRSRMRAAWIQRSDDHSTALACYRQFCDAKLPLTP